MIEQLANLADSRNVALILSLVANVVLMYAVKRLFARIEENVSSKEQLAQRIIADYLEEKKRDAKNPPAD